MQKRTILLGPLSVQMMLLRLVSWMISMQLVLRLLVRPRLRLSLSGLKILLRKSWSNTTFRQQPMAHFQISRKPSPTSRKKALRSSSRQTAWPLVKVSSLQRPLSKPSKPLTRCFWTINSVIQVRVWSSRNSLTGKSFLSLPLSMGISSTSCQRLRTTNVLMMAIRVLTLVGWVPMRQFLTYHRAWLTRRLTLLSSQFLKV